MQKLAGGKIKQNLSLFKNWETLSKNRILSNKEHKTYSKDSEMTKPNNSSKLMFKTTL
jgi:hypothetical protein